MKNKVYKLEEKGSSAYTYKDMVFELGAGQILLKDAKTLELIRVVDVKNDFDMRDLKNWCNEKLLLDK